MRRWWLRQRLMRAYRRYTEARSKYDCGDDLAHHISPRLGTLWTNVVVLAGRVATDDEDRRVQP